MTPRMLIVGGGIAGLALAALMDERWHVTVSEQAAGRAGRGFPVDVRGDALDVVRHLGLLGEIQARRTLADVVEVRAPDDTRIGILPSQAADGVEISRSDLVEILARPGLSGGAGDGNRRCRRSAFLGPRAGLRARGAVRHTAAGSCRHRLGCGRGRRRSCRRAAKRTRSPGRQPSDERSRWCRVHLSLRTLGTGRGRRPLGQRSVSRLPMAPGSALGAGGGG